jgi:hypothetical protein
MAQPDETPLEAEETLDTDVTNFDSWDEETEETEVTEEAAAESEAEEDTEESEPEEESEETEEASEEPEEEALQEEESNEEVTTSKEEQKTQEREQSQQEYLQGAEDDTQLAVRQLQIDAYNNRVTFNRDKLESGIDRAMANIPELTKGAPEVKQELLRALDDYEKMNVKYDQNGDPVNVEGDVYQYLTERADSIRRLTGVGARQSAKDKSNAKSRTFTPPSKTPKQPKVDAELDAFDEEVNKGW